MFRGTAPHAMILRRNHGTAVEASGFLFTFWLRRN
jgi:hypothetical protein